MANSILTINMITREAVRLFKNSNAFIKNIDTQYDDSFAKVGAKIGQTIRIRLPNDFTVRTGPAASIQDTAEQSTTLTLATQQGVDVSFSSSDRTMSLDDYSMRILAPMVNVTAGAVAINVMSGVDGGVCNFVANTDAAGNILSPTAQTWLAAKALLSINSAPSMRRKLILDPITQARTVGSLTGLFNPAAAISDQYRKGEMQEALGWDWFEDQTVLKHTTGAYGGTGTPATIATTVAGGGQTGLTLTVAALGGPLAIGDIITVGTQGAATAGNATNAVNRVTKQTTGQLRQFVITAAAATGATSLSIYPAIIPYGGAAPGTLGQQQQYQTVDFSPNNGVNVNVVTLSGQVYRKNFGYVPEAITLGTADLELPKGVHEAARATFDGISMRFITAYDVKSDNFITRMDVLYGSLFIRPEWCVSVADMI